MKNILIIYIVLFLSILLYSSCQKYIQIKIKDSEPVLIINAEIDPSSQSNQVFITRSTSVYDQKVDSVTNAKVILTNENTQESIQLRHKGNGFYSLTDSIKYTNAIYRLDVISDNITFTSRTQIAPRINDFKANLTKIENFGDSTRFYQLNGELTDTDPHHFNYYRLEIIINSNQQKEKNYVFFDDSYLISGTNTLKIQTLAPLKNSIWNTDIIIFNLQSISKESFQFSQELNQILNPRDVDFGEKAGNPTSTFNNGALGNFSMSYQNIFNPN